MSEKTISDQEFATLFSSLGAAKLAERLGIHERNVYRRRERLEKSGLYIPAPTAAERSARYERRFCIELLDGVMMVGSDCHYYPHRATTAHRALVKFARELQPKIICLNGDVTNGTKNSNHAEITWEGARPNVRQELEAIDERTTEIRDANKAARLIWNLGNHDARFESKLSAKVPEYEGVRGFALADHFPEWKIVWSTWVNGRVVIKHRWKGGIHATHNNTVNAGLTMVTGHLHSLKVTPFTDYTGTRYGVDTGTLEEPNGPHADYTEENPLNHRSGFIVLTFHKGELLWPEVVAVVDANHVQFRGQIFEV